MLSLFKIAGVSCTSGFADSDTYHSGVNPAFINSTDIAAFPFGGRCVGWKSVPAGSFDCGAVPKDSVTRRLCPCTCGTLKSQSNPLPTIMTKALLLLELA